MTDPSRVSVCTQARRRETARKMPRPTPRRRSLPKTPCRSKAARIRTSSAAQCKATRSRPRSAAISISKPCRKRETYEEKNTSASFDLSWDINSGKFSKPTFGLSAGRGTIDSHYRNTRGQSGIFAGKGGFDIYVEKNTDLKGAVIASEAEAGKNRLSTGTFSFSDLENGADYSAKSIGAEYHHYGSYDKMSRQEKNKVYNTIGLSPSLSMPAKGDANSTTTSAVAPGTIDIRKNPTQDISALNRDTNTL